MMAKNHNDLLAAGIMGKTVDGDMPSDAIASVH
jgi:hypothetical protein